MELKLYHGTSEPDAIGILSSQQMHPSKGEKHYLGSGVYFYEDPYQANVWAELKAQHLGRTTRVAHKPFVLVAIVVFDDEVFMDLDMRRDQEEFFRHRYMYHESILMNKLSTGYYNDSLFCDLISSTLGVTVMSKTFPYVHSKYGQIPTVYSNFRKTNRNISRHHWTEKQFCIKDITAIKNITPWEVSDDE